MIRRHPLSVVGYYLLAALVLFYALFPFFYAIGTSFKTGTELFQPSLWPDHPTVKNYVGIFREQPFATNILNSVLVSCSIVAISLALSVMAAWALARVSFRGRGLLLFTIMGATSFPQVAVACSN